MSPPGAATTARHNADAARPRRARADFVVGDWAERRWPSVRCRRRQPALYRHRGHRRACRPRCAISTRAARSTAAPTGLTPIARSPPNCRGCCGRAGFRRRNRPGQDGCGRRDPARRAVSTIDGFVADLAGDSACVVARRQSASRKWVERAITQKRLDMQPPTRLGWRRSGARAPHRGTDRSLPTSSCVPRRAARTHDPTGSTAIRQVT